MIHINVVRWGTKCELALLTGQCTLYRSYLPDKTQILLIVLLRLIVQPMKPKPCITPAVKLVENIQIWLIPSIC